MENARKYLPFIIGGFVAILVFFVSRKMRKSNQANTERSTILEKAREAKLAKSILKNSDENQDDQESTTT
jgi:phosphotransferase system  glucose/maltose/N-acetylglucosamine-specific IIC component